MSKEIEQSIRCLKEAYATLKKLEASNQNSIEKGHIAIAASFVEEALVAIAVEAQSPQDRLTPNRSRYSEV